MYISLSNVFFASKFGWKTLYSAPHRLYLFFHRLYPTTQRLFYVIFHPVLSISNFWPSEVIYIFYILLSIVYIQLSLVSIFYFPPSFLYFVTCTRNWYSSVVWTKLKFSLKKIRNCFRLKLLFLFEMNSSDFWVHLYFHRCTWWVVFSLCRMQYGCTFQPSHFYLQLSLSISTPETSVPGVDEASTLDLDIEIYQ